MLMRTKNKVQTFSEKLKLSLKQFNEHYRVFVPFNTQMP